MTAAPSPPLPEPGTVLAGKYRIEHLLGKGGMGAVYAAHHELLAQRVAVKLLLTDVAASPEGLQRFLNEARAAARLDSEHVARVMDVGTLDTGLPYMVLEYLEGADLSQALEARGPLPYQEVVDHLMQACEALAQAHAAGIVHRDLKPSNLYLARRQDGTSRIKVLDFGISKVSDQSLTPKALTSTSAMLGTPYYMSPEQFVSPRSVDARTDIWSLGIILYELLSGQPPFLGETLGQLMYGIMNLPPAPLGPKRPDLPPGLEQVMLRCMERDLTRRFVDVAEVAAALAPFGTGEQTPLLDRMARTLQARAASPGGPPVGASTAARVQTGGGPPVTGSGAYRPPATGGAPGQPPVQTAAAWGQASAPGVPAVAAPTSRAPLIAGATIVTLLVFVGVGVALTRGRGHAVDAPSAAATQVAPPTAAPPPPPPVVVPPAAETAAAATAPAASAPPAPSGTAAAPTASPAAAAAPTGHAPAAAAPAAPKKPPPAPAAPGRPSDQLPDNSRK